MAGRVSPNFSVPETGRFGKIPPGIERSRPQDVKSRLNSKKPVLWRLCVIFEFGEVPPHPHPAYNGMIQRRVLFPFKSFLISFPLIPYRTKLRRTKFSSDKIFRRTKLTKFRVLEMEEEAVFWDFKLPILYCLRQLCETISSDKISSPSQNFVTFVRRDFVR